MVWWWVIAAGRSLVQSLGLPRKSLMLVEENLDASFHCLTPITEESGDVAKHCGHGCAMWCLIKPHTGTNQQHKLLSTNFLISHRNFIDYNQVLMRQWVAYFFMEWVYFEDQKMSNQKEKNFKIQLYFCVCPTPALSHSHCWKTQWPEEPSACVILPCGIR